MSQITDLLKHRAPFLFVDHVTIEDDKIVGERTFKEDELFFKGHFPGYPIVPGVLLVESMAQCGGAGLRVKGDMKSSNFVLIKIENARFHREVKPGETIKMIIKNELISETVINQSGKAYVGDEIVVRAEWMCAIKPEME
ncbi:MAG: 3-hydroxyacyl-ACP dehydratase FabZ [Bacteroidales bacterium]|nr:3-hydroxyacyl-ACP dehydratase FabZ [Bacteroidales bacterium]